MNTPPARPSSPSRPRITAILPGLIVSTLLDVIKPMLVLDRNKQVRFCAALESFIPAHRLKGTDLAIFCRNTEPRYAALLQYLRQNRIPYIYDLDDNLFEIPLSNELGNYHRYPHRLGMLETYLRQAALVRVYSPGVYERVAELGARVELVKAPLDWALIQPRQPHRKIRIVYVTSRRRDTLADIFAPALRQVLQRYPDSVEVTFCGALPEGFAGQANIHHMPFEPNYDAFMRKFSAHSFDIGLAPMVDDAFHRSKTNNKFREYGACGIAGIYSSSSVYAEVSAGELGLVVANTSDQWAAALTRLIEDAALRQQIAAQAEDYIRRNYSQEEFCATWERQIAQCLAEVPAAWPDTPAGMPPADDPAIPADPNQQTRWEKLRAMTPADIIQKAALVIGSAIWLLKINILKKI
ncbi:MAG TPA: glycosyltransferase [Anaerolineaceae bacterium]|nr:glycosyltransferase [Anaerolineaceae bacterium]